MVFWALLYFDRVIGVEVVKQTYFNSVSSASRFGQELRKCESPFQNELLKLTLLEDDLTSYTSFNPVQCLFLNLQAIDLPSWEIIRETIDRSESLRILITAAPKKFHLSSDFTAMQERFVVKKIGSLLVWKRTRKCSKPLPLSQKAPVFMSYNDIEHFISYHRYMWAEHYQTELLVGPYSTQTAYVRACAHPT